MAAAHKPTIEIRAKVSALASFGIPQTRISKYIGICEPTLTKYYREELDNSSIDKIVMVANALYHNAVEMNNVTAQIFFLKTQAGWKDQDKDKLDTSPEIGKIQIEVLPGKEIK